MQAMQAPRVDVDHPQNHFFVEFLFFKKLNKFLLTLLTRIKKSSKDWTKLISTKSLQKRLSDKLERSSLKSLYNLAGEAEA
jgi:hypothetical protein